MILHIPHSSSVVPRDLRDQLLLSDEELSAELTLMTDAFTDELFACSQAATVRFPLSRLAVDVERFPEDTDEPMSKVGMGMIYTRTSSGGILRRPLADDEKRHLRSLYDGHHRTLEERVKDELVRKGRALIVDCHSFADRPLPCDQDQSLPRPSFCLGTDPFHTPPALVRIVAGTLESMGYSVQVDRPFAGALVPMAFWTKDPRVMSVMIEVNRRLYLDEATGSKTNAFRSLQAQLGILLSSMDESCPAWTVD